MKKFEEFRNSIKKVSEPRRHKIRNSYGIYDGFKFYRKNKPKGDKYILTESQYFMITRMVNNIISDELIKGNDIIFPNNMGRLELRKYNRKVSLDKDNKIKTNLPINWDKTLKLWYEDKESYSNKTLVRVESNEIFTVYYNKGKANYSNKSFYEFNVNRNLKQRLKNRIKVSKVDALQLGKNFKYD